MLFKRFNILQYSRGATLDKFEMTHYKNHRETTTKSVSRLNFNPEFPQTLFEPYLFCDWDPFLFSLLAFKTLTESYQMENTGMDFLPWIWPPTLQTSSFSQVARCLLIPMTLYKAAGQFLHARSRLQWCRGEFSSWMTCFLSTRSEDLHSTSDLKCTELWPACCRPLPFPQTCPAFKKCVIV